jgi:hypothetical protein
VVEAPVRTRDGIEVRFVSALEEVGPDRGNQQHMAECDNADKRSHERDDEDVGKHRCNSVAEIVGLSVAASAVKIQRSSSLVLKI